MHWIILEASSFHEQPHELAEWIATYHHMRCRFRFSEAVRMQARRMQALLGPGDYLAAHVRRGDK